MGAENKSPWAFIGRHVRGLAKAVWAVVCFAVPLAISAIVFSTLFWIMPQLEMGRVRLVSGAPFWITFASAFAFGWVPFLIAYSGIDYSRNRSNPLKAIYGYALWGAFAAVLVPVFTFLFIVLLAGGVQPVRWPDIVSAVHISLWFFIPGAIAGVVFGALVPLGLPSSRDGRRAAR